MSALAGPSVTGSAVTSDRVTGPSVTGFRAGGTFKQILAALGPDHWWELNDASGNAIDIGTAGGLDGVPTGPPFRQQVGPQANGQDNPNSSAASFNTTGPRYYTASVLPTHSTGTILFWVKAQPDGSAAPIFFGTGDITTQGQATVSVSTANQNVGFGARNSALVAMSASSDPGTVLPGQYYFVAITQPGDGVGPRISINGAPVNTNYSGALSLDTWFDIAAQINTRIGSRGGTSVAPQFAGDLQDFAVFINRILTPAEILSLYNGAINPVVPPTNFTETIRSYSPLIWMRMHEENGSLVTAGSVSNFMGPRNTPTYRQAGPLVNETPTWSIDLDPGDDFLGSGVVLPTTGSVVCFFNTDTVAATPSNIYTQGDATSANYIFFARFANTFYMGIPRPAGTLLQVQINASALSLSTGTWYMGVVTQAADGNGPRMYVDAVEYSGADLTVTVNGAASLDDWFSVLTATATRTRVGVVPGTGNQNPWDGKIGQVIVLPNVLTQEEITELYDLARVAA